VKSWGGESQKASLNQVTGYSTYAQFTGKAKPKFSQRFRLYIRGAIVSESTTARATKTSLKLNTQ